MGNFNTNCCNHAQADLRLHPRVEIWRRRQNSKGQYPGPNELSEENEYYLSTLYKVVEFTIGTDTNTGNTISLSASGKLKAYYAFGWDVLNGDTGYDLTMVRAKLVVYGGAVVQGNIQNTTNGTLDFTDNGGLHSGILTLGLEIIL